MKKGAKDNFFVKHKKDLIYLGIPILVLVIGIIIFMQLKNNSNVDDSILQKIKNSGDSSDNTSENDGELGSGGVLGVGSNSAGGSSGTGTEGGSGTGGGSGSIRGPGGGGSDGSGESSGINSTGNSSASSGADLPLTDTIFPYTTQISNGGTINFRYFGVIYTLTVSWPSADYQTKITSSLRANNREIAKIYHAHGENRTTGFLLPGEINYFDINSDSRPEIQLRHFPYTDAWPNLRIRVHVNNLEICDDGIDNDGNGLKDCREEDCDESLGSHLLIPDYFNYAEGYNYIYCSYNREFECFDNFDNDADGVTDTEDRDCIGKTCNRTEGADSEAIWSYGTWSYVPEEDPALPPARRGCCPEDYCVTADNKCIAYDVAYKTPAGNTYYICGDNNNWDRCGPLSAGMQVNKYPGNRSDGDGFFCASADGKYGWFAGYAS